MKKKRVLSTLLAGALALSLAACGSSSGSTSTGSTTASSASSGASEASTTAGTETAETGDDIVNIGATNELGTLNPLNMDWSFINLYATSMMFLPLVTVGADNNFNYLLADSITTDDNLTFTIKIRDDAVWSDGEPVTSDDVIFTILRMTSPEVANPNFDFSMFKGFESGTSPEGAESVDGLVKVDDKTLQFVANSPMSLNTFINNCCVWICILPSHVLKDVPADQLVSYDWFQHPDVVDGPYILDDYDSAHYISYHANENYFLGAPKIPKMNIRIVDPSEILPQLQAGEIDFVPPATCSIPITDQEAVENLDGYTSSWTDPITNEMTFFNTTKVTDARVRKAFVMAIDRQTLVDSLLSGHGEVTDGFVMKSSPLYDDSKETIPYDPDGAKELLSEAGWDSSTVLQYYVSSGDDTAVKAAQVIQQELSEVGISININTVDFDTLMSVGGTDDVDVFSVQYTITPNDFYADELGLVDTEGTSWTGGWTDPDVDAALQNTQTAKDDTELAGYYKEIDDKMISDVPMFSMYFQSNLGVVSNRLQNAEPTLYGAYDNIQDWEIVQ
ncbi:MAG TPA: ABC transporter substrate-binding protein [Lachnospiraceae bacterium]|nr:ABC transporter substrate-binding protein [Lachnospiraceae bacterium]